MIEEALQHTTLAMLAPFQIPGLARSMLWLYNYSRGKYWWKGNLQLHKNLSYNAKFKFEIYNLFKQPQGECYTGIETQRINTVTN